MRLTDLTPQETKIPRFKLGQIVFVVYGPKIKRGYISDIKIEGSIQYDSKQNMIYKFSHIYTIMDDPEKSQGCLGVSFDDRKVFASKEEVLEHMEKSI